MSLQTNSSSFILLLARGALNPRTLKFHNLRTCSANKQLTGQNSNSRNQQLRRKQKASTNFIVFQLQTPMFKIKIRYIITVGQLTVKQPTRAGSNENEVKEAVSWRCISCAVVSNSCHSCG